ncbi:hypothetical protein E2C01_031299 [Portunus trituberculatus]|uniref:Uncharacterized protein n=1 Tax=Portunus trituberculatus TaxID=210409 RepID=A0A5B7EXA7_PORTR|nr:hypothetical protein [Portunus trituberculatus]
MSSEGPAQNTACPFSSAQAISLEKAERHRRISQPGILSGAGVAWLSVALLMTPLLEESAKPAGSTASGSSSVWGAARCPSQRTKQWEAVDVSQHVQ